MSSVLSISWKSEHSQLSLAMVAIVLSFAHGKQIKEGSPFIEMSGGVFIFIFLEMETSWISP